MSSYKQNADMFLTCLGLFSGLKSRPNVPSMRPEAFVVRWARRLSKVVLPAPEEPIIAVTVPALQQPKESKRIWVSVFFYYCEVEVVPV